MAHSNSGEDFLNNFKIPKYVLVPKSESEKVPDVPQCPVLVFINSRSGGQLGGDLLVTYRSLLNETQVLIYIFLFCMVKCCQISQFKLWIDYYFSGCIKRLFLFQLFFESDLELAYL